MATGNHPQVTPIARSLALTHQFNRHMLSARYLCAIGFVWPVAAVQHQRMDRHHFYRQTALQPWRPNNVSKFGVLEHRNQIVDEHPHSHRYPAACRINKVDGNPPRLQIRKQHPDSAGADLVRQ